MIVSDLLPATILYPNICVEPRMCDPFMRVLTTGLEEGTNGRICDSQPPEDCPFTVCL